MGSFVIGMLLVLLSLIVGGVAGFVLGWKQRGKKDGS